MPGRNPNQASCGQSPRDSREDSAPRPLAQDSSRLRRHRPDLAVQVRGGDDAAVEVAEVELLVGGVGVLVGQADAEKDARQAESSWNVDTTGIEPPSRLKTGRLPKPASIARPAAWT